MATITATQGLVDDGSGNLTVQGTVQGSHVPSSAALVGNPNVLTAPGTYLYQSGVLGAQATLPAANLMPGAVFVFAPYQPTPPATGGLNIVLSGTAVNAPGNNTACFYQQVSGSSGGSGLFRGKFLTTATSGSVGLMSDGTVWNVIFASGSLTFA